MNTIVDMHSEVRHRAVFELRFAMGYEFWDRAGRVINSILAEFSESSWKLEGIDPNAARLLAPEENLQFAFGPTKADLSQTQSTEQEEILSHEEFAVLAERLTQTVLEVLAPTGIDRVGYRVWRLYGTVDKAEAESLIRRAKLLQLPEGIGDIAETTATLVIERPDHMIRAALVAFEQSIEVPRYVLEAARAKPEAMDKNQRAARRSKYIAMKAIKNYPHSGVLFDCDAYIEDIPMSDDFSISQFVLKAEEDVAMIKPSLLEARNA